MAEKALSPKRGKRLSFFLLDFLIASAGACFLSLLATPIAESFPSVRQEISSLAAIQKDMGKIIEESHLNSFTEEGHLQTFSDLANAHLLSLTKASLLEGGVSEQDLSSLYDSVLPASPDHDRVYEYLVSFKPSRLSSFDEPGEYGEIAYRTRLFSTEGLSFVTEGYPFFTLECAKTVDEGIRDESYQKGVKAKEEFLSLYVSMLGDCAEDLSAHYLPYAKLEERQNKISLSVERSLAVATWVSAFLSLAVFRFIVPLCGDGRTLGARALKLEFVDQDGKVPMASLLKLFSPSLLLFPLVAFLPSLFSFGLASPFSALFGPFSIFDFACLALVLACLNELPSFFKTKQSALERFARLSLTNKEVSHD